MFACSDHCAVSFGCWVHENKVSKTRFYLLQFFWGGSSVIRRPNLQSCIQSVCLTYQTDSNWHDSLYWAYIRWLKSSLAFYTLLVGRTYSRAWNFHWSAGRWSVKCPTDQWKSPSTGLLDQQFLQELKKRLLFSYWSVLLHSFAWLACDWLWIRVKQCVLKVKQLSEEEP